MSNSRPAHIEDRALLEELFKRAHSEVAEQRGGEIYLLTEIRSDFSNLEADIEGSSCHLVVGIYEDLVVGWGFALHNQIPNGPKVGKVQELYVQPEVRGVGVGESILSALLEWIKETGCAGIEGTSLPGNRESKGIFERFGVKTRMLTLYKSFTDS